VSTPVILIVCRKHEDCHGCLKHGSSTWFTRLMTYCLLQEQDTGGYHISRTTFPWMVNSRKLITNWLVPDGTSIFWDRFLHRQQWAIIFVHLELCSLDRANCDDFCQLKANWQKTHMQLQMRIIYKVLWIFVICYMYNACICMHL